MSTKRVPALRAVAVAAAASAVAVVVVAAAVAAVAVAIAVGSFFVTEEGGAFAREAYQTSGNAPFSHVSPPERGTVRRVPPFSAGPAEISRLEPPLVWRSREP